DILLEFDDTLDVFEKDISDPIGGSLEVYLECRDQIEQGIASMLKFIDQTFGGPAAGATREKTVHVALGADHAGYELKEALRQHLEKRGLRVLDFGANSTVSSDYPDFARAVAHAVAEQKSDLGLLVCASGVGMSITANKVPGVRAALVFDEKMAALARQHNNANVLCLGGRFVGPEQAKKIVDAFLEAHFEGGRHARRADKVEHIGAARSLKLSTVDPEIAEAI